MKSLKIYFRTVKLNRSIGLGIFYRKQRLEISLLIFYIIIYSTKDMWYIVGNIKDVGEKE